MIIGRIVSAAVILVLLLDAGVILFAPSLVQAEMAAVGFPVQLAPILAAIMFVCAVVYLVPMTVFIGAILITGFFGGAIFAHLRIGEMVSPPQLVSMLMGVATWLGLYLRDTRLRDLVFRSG